MLQRMRELAASIAKLFARGPSVAAGTSEPATPGTPVFAPLLALATSRRTVATLVAVGALGATGYFFYQHPPMKSVGRGEIGLRVNQLTGTVDQFHEGSVLVLPGLHQMRVYSLRDQAYRPEGISRADGASPVQSIEGLSLGVDLTIRYALDPAKIGAVYKNLPDNVGAEIVEPAVQGIVYKVFARYTVREIFSTKRGEIQKAIETELAAQLARDGVALHGVQMGKVDLPADYRRGMESLLAEELASEKMRFTLELKDKQVKETELVAEADKVRREKAAEAAGQEQIIAAKAQEEAMKHVLPFKQKQIEQRSLEAEAREGRAHQGRRRQRPGAAHRGHRRGRRAAKTGRRRSLSPGTPGQGHRGANGGRGRAGDQAPAADPEDPGRQALRQDPGDHRSAPGGRRLHRRHPAGRAKARRRQDRRCQRARPRATRRRRHAGHQGRAMIMRRLAIAIAALTVIIALLALAAKTALAAPAQAKPAPAAAAPARPAVALPAPAAPVPVAPAQAAGLAIVIEDRTSLRAAPRGSAQQQAVLWQGEVLEVRGERLDYLQVYDHKRERGGFVHASLVRRTGLTAAEAPELLSVIRFIRESPGAEALGIGLTAAYLQAAPAEALDGAAGIEAFDALGGFADRLARRASSGSLQDKAAAALLSAPPRGRPRYGIGFASYEYEGRMRICYNGEAFRRVLALPASPEQRVRAALALTRPECVNPDLGPLEHARLDQWRADVLDRADTAGLPGYLKNRLLMRRAAVWSSIAYQHARLAPGGRGGGGPRPRRPDGDQQGRTRRRPTPPRTATPPCASALRAGRCCPAARKSIPLPPAPARPW